MRCFWIVFARVVCKVAGGGRTLKRGGRVQICYKCGSGANSLQCVVDTDDQATYDAVKAKISGTGDGSLCSEPQG